MDHANDRTINIRNAKTLFWTGAKYIIDEVDMLISNSIVIGFERNGDVPQIDFSNWLLLPSFFNIHSHLGETIFRNIYGESWTLQKYLTYTENHNNSLTQQEREKEWVNSAHQTIALQKDMGIVGFCAARSAHIAEEYKLCNMTGYPIMNSNKLYRFKQKGLRGFKEYFQKYNNDICSVGLFLHSLYCNDDDSLNLAKNCMESGAEFITCHISEDEWSRKKEYDAFGSSPIDVLQNYNILNDKTVLVHGGYLTSGELVKIKESGAIIAICPLSNIFLHNKIADVIQLENMEIPWSVGTDGLATGRTFSLLTQCATLKKQMPHITYEKMLYNITERPAKLYNRKIFTGRIEQGTIATFIGIQYNEKSLEKMLTMLFEGELQHHVLAF